MYITDLGPGTQADQAPGGSGPQSNPRATTYKYVDDTKVYGRCTNQEDVLQFQEELNNIYSWASSNKMKWNSLKLQLLRLGPDNSLKEDTLLFSENLVIYDNLMV